MTSLAYDLIPVCQWYIVLFRMIHSQFQLFIRWHGKSLKHIQDLEMLHIGNSHFILSENWEMFARAISCILASVV